MKRKYSKNIIATIVICGVVSTVAFAAANVPLWTLDGQVLQTQADKNGTWVFVPKNFEIGTLINKSNRKLNLTEENFDKVNKEGTTYETICEIFGGKGKLEIKFVNFDPDEENGKHVRAIYVWEDGCTKVEFDLVNGKVFNPRHNEFTVNYRPSIYDCLARLEQIKPKK